MKGIHISFSGIDGSGKTTMAGLTARFLKDMGYNSFLNENNDTFSWNIMQTISNNRNMDFREYFGNDNAELLMSFDALRDFYYKILPNLNMGNIVVSSRSNYDRICKAELFNCNNMAIISEIQKLTITEDIHFYMEISTDIAIKRVNLRGKDRETYNTLDKYNEIIKNHATINGWIKIQASLSRERVFKQIKDYIIAYLGRLNV